MRLTRANILHVIENHLATGKIAYAVVMKGHAMSDCRFFDSYNELPKTVIYFMENTKCVLLDCNEKMGYTKYIYR